MEKPLSTLTLKRQTSFFVSATAFLSIYIFDIDLAPMAETAVNIKLKPEYVTTTLFWVTALLFVRYAINLISDVFFMTWQKNWIGSAHKLTDVMSLNSNVINILKVPACKFTVRKMAKFKEPYYQPNDQVVEVSESIHDIFQDENSTLSQDERMSEAIRVMEEARLQILSYSKYMYWKLARQLFHNLIGYPAFVGYLLFEIILPIGLICIVVDVAYFNSEWIKYENLSWLWIDGPR
ncbi:hypothetical protein EBB79_08450 [Parasedimentitalea marina]|uniref:Uncharacterized protein n=1 Tax=Parasedimentitalea marina TaxID=2483033 RepID=A0A3T0N1P6_9RHOB|nr:hypothetical protein [Parasedimentitalea marina]AZV77921.1 hypothetical protein EBB79_08450 [Parasedimentitalea marina]